jgi:tryptophan synthase beta chain
LRIGRELGPEAILAVCLSGRGDKDMDTAARYFDLYDREAAERDAADKDAVTQAAADKGTAR